MIRLIVGLGNPGRQYEKTRHNAGFLFLDYLQSEVGASWAAESRFNADLSHVHWGARKVLLLKPQTFMNKSGLSVRSVVQYYKIKPEEILVVHDELDFEAGQVKLKKGGGHAGHNGLRDIIVHLGSRDFCRVRLGIGRPAGQKKVVDYVLSDFSKQEKELLVGVFSNLSRHMDGIVEGELSAVMNVLNSA